MGLLDYLKGRQNPLSSFDNIEILYESQQRAYLKKMALETCINFIGRNISQSEFRIVEGKKPIKDDWHYLLNVRPNSDQSASDFWQDFTYKLIHENEVLVVVSDDNQLLIADSFYREEFALYPDIFRYVTVKGYTFKRSFKMDEVIYITYNNEKLDSFMKSMFKDYSDLFNRMIETSMFSNQIRATVAVDSTQNLDDANQKKLQDFMNKLFDAFRKNAFALVPKMKGFEYNEVMDGGKNNGRSVEELAKLKRDLLTDVANILGIPVSLVYGEMAEYETAIKAFIKFCLNPLLKKISDELNAKLFTKNEYLAGKKIEVWGIRVKDVTESADVVDKLIASGAYTRNEVREKFGDERSDNPKLDEYVITKNYTSVEGGEKDEND